ncbi:hypothetical protein AGMMS49921_08160 [Endomicrobiia bacterium]|nr:hypothetical protein AGMMS49921_08160 [Endomicrobiia bacterium]
MDIFSVLGYSDNNKESQESVFAVAQNILVLAVGNNYIGIAIKKLDKTDDVEEDSGIVTLLCLSKKCKGFLPVAKAV